MAAQGAMVVVRAAVMAEEVDLKSNDLRLPPSAAVDGQLDLALRPS